jgi:ornithine--oxo-acid transaminase
MGVLTPGPHRAPVRGNPLAAAVGRAVVGLLWTGEFQARARELGEVLNRGLLELVGNGVVEVRARGLWAGIDIDESLMTGREMSERLMRRGVLVKDTHGSTVRIAPPLVVGKDDIDWALEQFADALQRP